MTTIEQLRRIKFTLDEGIDDDHIMQIYDGYDVRHLDCEGAIAMTKDVLDIFIADWKRNLQRQYTQDTGKEMDDEDVEAEAEEMFEDLPQLGHELYVLWGDYEYSEVRYED